MIMPQALKSFAKLIRLNFWFSHHKYLSLLTELQSSLLSQNPGQLMWNWHSIAMPCCMIAR
jgi:hypothetical protein